MKGQPFQLQQHIPWQDLGNGVERQLFGFDDQLMMVKIKFISGATGSPHHHPHRQVTYIESGVFDMTIGGTTQRLQKGDGYFVMPGVQHGITCIEAGMLVDVFSPHRADFLEG